MTASAKNKRGLGRGLDSLLPPLDDKIKTRATVSEIGIKRSPTYREIEIDRIVPGRLQPRTIFDEDEISDLATSIQEHGILEPLIVSPISDSRYELIAGERRLRAAQKVGISRIPAVIKDVDPESMLLMSLVENIQREDLSPIEEARAYKTLVDQFSYTQDQVSKKVGRSRSAVANSLRLLDLPGYIQEDVLLGKYTAGHARTLLTITDASERENLRQKLIAGLSVREAEEEARKRERRA